MSELQALRTGGFWAGFSRHRIASQLSELGDLPDNIGASAFESCWRALSVVWDCSQGTSTLEETSDSVESRNKAVRCCGFFGVRPLLMRYAAIRSCSVSIAANWFRKVWGESARRQPASSGSDCGSCCGTRLTTKSSVVADRSTKVVQPVRGCLTSGMVRTVTDRLIRRPALPG